MPSSPYLLDHEFCSAWFKLLSIHFPSPFLRNLWIFVSDFLIVTFFVIFGYGLNIDSQSLSTKDFLWWLGIYFDDPPITLSLLQTAGIKNLSSVNNIVSSSIFDFRDSPFLIAFLITSLELGRLTLEMSFLVWISLNHFDELIKFPMARA